MAEQKLEFGMFCWLDVATREVSHTQAFFRELLGWEYHPVPMPEGDYTMVRLGGKDFGGFMDLSSPKMPQGVPAHISAYVLVENVDAKVSEFTKAGGSVKAPAFDVADMGRMAVVADPFGAVLSLWQPKKTGSGAIDPMTLGAPSWRELMTTNLDGAVNFYRKIFGWKTQSSSNPQFEYVECGLGQQPFAGMMQITKEMGPMPPNWGTYFTVKDCAATVKKAQTKGAMICLGPKEIPTVGTFAVIREPNGIFFNVIQYQHLK